MIYLISFIIISPFYLIVTLVYLIIWIFELLLMLCFSKSTNEFVKKYTFKQMVSVDQSVNALMAGDEDETISSRMGRRFPDSWFRKLLDKVLGEGHCKQSIEPEEGKDDLVP